MPAHTKSFRTSILWAELVELLQDEILQRLGIDAREVSIISCSVYIGNSIIDVPGIQNVFLSFSNIRGMSMSSSWGLTSYTKNQVLEQDGFQVVYSAYKWTDRQDAAIEIAEEDITLTVTEEYISLDCTKKDYAMYLSVADSSTVAQYLYNYNRRTKSATEANTIYTEAAIKK